VDAHHIHITQLPHHLADIPRDRESSIFCGSGLRATLAASYLQREGWVPVKVVLGGTKGWDPTACPLDL
jgi:hydroxyacylglutathione hydrolase